MLGGDDAGRLGSHVGKYDLRVKPGSTEVQAHHMNKNKFLLMCTYIIFCTYQADDKCKLIMCVQILKVNLYNVHMYTVHVELSRKYATIYVFVHISLDLLCTYTISYHVRTCTQQEFFSFSCGGYMLS